MAFPCSPPAKPAYGIDSHGARRLQSRACLQRLDQTALMSSALQRFLVISPVNPSLTKLQLLAVIVAIKYLREPSGMQPAPPEKRVKCLKLLHFGFHRANRFCEAPW